MNYLRQKNYKTKSTMAQERLFGGQLQTFSALIEGNRVYVDKTDLIYSMTHEFDRVFLSRPRRFGKSLLCSTLKSYFEGRRDLFKSLAIEKLEKDWTKYPVLHFDMSGGKHMEKDALERFIGLQLKKYEDEYSITPNTPDSNNRLITLIEKAYAKEGQKVVVIVDEYDAPLLDVVHEEKNLNSLRNVMRNFYSPLKACDQYLRFVFLTGITKFSQLSIFSELNNLVNISMIPEYAAICGITEEELLTQLSVDIDNMAENLGETREETIMGLKKMYDGYHFTWPSPDVYNPFSLINSLSIKRRKFYWFESGTPTYLIEMLRKLKVVPSKIGGVRAYAEDFDTPTNQIENITPLLYQSGYITIKNSIGKSGRYMLDIPNTEVRDGLMKSLLPYYVTPALKMETNTMIGDMIDMIDEDDMDGALRMLQEFLLGVPYVDFLKGEAETTPDGTKKRRKKQPTDYEGHYQQLLYVIFTLLGCQRVYTEVRTATGRIDMTLETRTRIYVIEIKVNKSVESALDQIDTNKYTAKYSLQPLPVYKLGINFDTKARTLESWKLEEA